ncbi:MAG: hypothetical protein FJW34_26130, partial [Acidobacteria bacterium]|nr:hypothetical protein [Acidobacteriota bacterium]
MMKETRDPVAMAGWLAAGAGAATAGLGLAVLAGWATGNLRLIHGAPGLPAMPPVSALAFLLSGVALLAATLRWNRVALVVGLLVAAGGAVSLVEWSLGVEFGVDLTLARRLAAEIPFPDRMPPNAALCFLLTGIGLALPSGFRHRGHGGLPGALSGSMVFSLGAIALAGYSLELPTYGWWKVMTRMAVHGAAGFTITGVGLVTLAWRREQAQVAGPPRWLPLPVGLATLTSTLCLWQAMEAAEEAHIEAHARLVGVSVETARQALLPLPELVLPSVGLVTGLLLSALATAAVYLALTAQRRAAQAELARAALERSEADLQRVRAELEVRVRERTAELESFTYSVSHDLRAPLRHIDGYSKLLLEEAGARLEGDSRRWLERIREGAQQMASMVDDLLALSRMGRREPARRLAEQRALVEAALRDLRHEMADREMDLRVGELPPADCDPALVKQVWVNLLSNALKFTRIRPRTVIEVGCESGTRGNAFYVRDNGVGFDMKYADKLFGVFQRLHRREDFDGTGVGLATV